MKRVCTICVQLVLAAAGVGVAQASPVTYEVFGTVTDPGVGSPLVAAGDPFRFAVTLDPANGPVVTARDVSYGCGGGCAWALSAGGYLAGGSSPGALRIVNDPAYHQYPYPFVVEILVMQNAPSLGEVYAAVIVGASARPLSGEFVLPTFDAFDQIFGFFGIVVPGPAEGGNRISSVTVLVTSTRSVPEPVSLILLTIGVGSGVMRVRKRHRCRGLVA